MLRQIFRRAEQYVDWFRITPEQFLTAARTNERITVQSYIAARDGTLNSTPHDRHTGREGLALAATHNHVDIARDICAAGINPTALFIPAATRYGNGKPLLEVAVENDNIELVECLLDGGADINESCSSGVTPLELALASGHRNIAMRLIQRDADVNKAHHNARLTPLGTAVAKGYLDIAALMIQRGANVNGALYGRDTPLMAAAENGNLDAVNLLLAAKANVDQSSQGTDVFASDPTPLSYAANKGHNDVVRALIAGGADVNARVGNWIALYYAVRDNNTDMTVQLLAAGAKPNFYAGYNEKTSFLHNDTPFRRAVFNKNYDMVTMLMNAGAEANLDAAIANNNIEMMDWLIDAGVEIDKLGETGETSLTLAIERGYDDIAARLIERGADVHALNKKGESALMIAAKRNNVKMIGLLVAAKANVDQVTPQGNMTALMLATYNYKADAVKALLAAKADPNIVTAPGKKPNLDVYTVLLVPFTGPVYEYWTALTFAVYIKNSDITEQLHAAGADPRYATAQRNENGEPVTDPLFEDVKKSMAILELFMPRQKYDETMRMVTETQKNASVARQGIFREKEKAVVAGPIPAPSLR